MREAAHDLTLSQNEPILQPGFAIRELALDPRLDAFLELRRAVHR